MGDPRKNLVPPPPDVSQCALCGEKSSFICIRCNHCETCEECRGKNGDITGTGWVHRLSYKGSEIRAIVRDHLAKGLPSKPGQQVG